MMTNSAPAGEAMGVRMSLVNQLICRARGKYGKPPADLTINDSQVSSIAEHARPLMFSPSHDKAELEAMICAGKMRFMGIPVRVVG